MLSASAQIQQAEPDNQANTLSPLGIPPSSSTTGDNEAINLATGALTVSLPLLTVPQKGGWKLTLGYIHNSNTVHPEEDVSVQTDTTNTSNQRGGDESRTFSYEYYFRYSAYSAPLETNLPRLQFSEEYRGAYKQINDYTNTEPYEATFCVNNLIFTDWAGAVHPFKLQGAGPCSDQDYTYLQGDKQGDSLDGSFYHVDLSSSSEIVITAIDGTSYHFTGNWNPYVGLGNNHYDGQTENYENYYDNRNVVMYDPNGNRVSVVQQPVQQNQPVTWLVTDTLGRQITIGQAGIDYLDSNSTSTTDVRHITLASKPGTPLSNPLSYGGMSCANLNQNQPDSPTQVRLDDPEIKALTSSATTLYTLSLPPSDNSGNTRQYQFLMDADQHLVRVDYPTGGYSRYDYTNYTVYNYSAQFSCAQDMFEVSAKHVCTAAGGCGSEDLTTYTVGSIFTPGDSASSSFNQTITETTPDGTSVQHSFSTNGSNSQPSGATRYQPLERDVVTTASSGNKLKAVHTDYTCTDAPAAICYPQQITTSLSDSPTGAATSVQMQYQNLYTTFAFGNLPLDQVTRMDTSDFAQNALSTVITSYKPATAFTPFHMLSRIDTVTTTDDVTNTSVKKQYGYDSLGNVTSIGTTGSDGASTSVGYGAYVAGLPSSMTDGRGFKTSFDYTDAFVPGPCVPSQQSGAYLTTSTAPDGSVSKYQYNGCTGSIANSTDSNGNVTTSQYDALGRRTSAVTPNAASVSTRYSDGVPNTISATNKATPNPDLVTTQTLDGLGRPVSVVRGDVQVDTTYDNIGRVWTVSNPRIVGSAGTGVSQNTYDGLSRLMQTTHPDNAAETTDYFGEFSVTRDGAGSTRVVQHNAQGLIATVCEVAPAFSASGESPAACQKLPNEPAFQGYLTQYNYDGRGNLGSVSARGQSRSFTYDSLSRLTSSTNPESGTICYGDTANSCLNGYDADGNLTKKVTANSIQITYSYDSIDRLTSKTYSDATPTACYSYSSGSSSTIPNGNSRLLAEWTQPRGTCSSASSAASPLTVRNILGYDAAGRVTQEQQCTLGSCANKDGSLQYMWDLTGSLTSATNGSNNTGIQMTYTADLSQRPLTVSSSWSDSSHPQTLFSADPSVVGTETYGPFGLKAAVLGIQQAGQSPTLLHATSYDNRGRINSNALYSLLSSSQSGVVGSGSENPAITAQLNANPVPAGNSAIYRTSCASSCGTGSGGFYVDGQIAGGFTYVPGDVQTSYLRADLSIGSHTLYVEYQDQNSGQYWHSKTSSFEVTDNSLPKPTLNLTLSPSPIPQGESAQITIQNSCATACGDGQMFIDGAFAGGLYFDDSGTAVNFTSTALNKQVHTLVVEYFGNGQFSNTSQSWNFTVTDNELPTPSFGVQFSPENTPSGEYNAVTISTDCNSACGNGQFFVDGGFAGGYYLDDSGTAQIQLGPYWGVGHHQFTISYSGDQNHHQANPAPWDYNVIDNNLPSPTMTVTPASTVTPVNQSTTATVSLQVPSAGVDCSGKGQLLVDGGYSDSIFFDSQGNMTANNGTPNAYVKAQSQSGTHTLEAQYFGNSTCHQATTGAVSYQVQ